MPLLPEGLLANFVVCRAYDDLIPNQRVLDCAVFVALEAAVGGFLFHTVDEDIICLHVFLPHSVKLIVGKGGVPRREIPGFQFSNSLCKCYRGTLRCTRLCLEVFLQITCCASAKQDLAFVLLQPGRIVCGSYGCYSTKGFLLIVEGAHELYERIIDVANVIGRIKLAEG